MWRLHVNARGDFAYMLSITDNLLNPPKSFKSMLVKKLRSKIVRSWKMADMKNVLIELTERLSCFVIQHWEQFILFKHCINFVFRQCPSTLLFLFFFLLLFSFFIFAFSFRLARSSTTPCRAFFSFAFYQGSARKRFRGFPVLFADPCLLLLDLLPLVSHLR